MEKVNQKFNSISIILIENEIKQIKKKEEEELKLRVQFSIILMKNEGFNHLEKTGYNREK